MSPSIKRVDSPNIVFVSISIFAPVDRNAAESSGIPPNYSMESEKLIYGKFSSLTGIEGTA